MFRLIDIIIDIIFFSINWKNYFDRSILVISMTVLVSTPKIRYLDLKSCIPLEASFCLVQYVLPFIVPYRINIIEDSIPGKMLAEVEERRQELIGK